MRATVIAAVQAARELGLEASAEYAVRRFIEAGQFGAASAP
jgi:hypothetical protein